MQLQREKPTGLVNQLPDYSRITDPLSLNKFKLSLKHYYFYTYVLYSYTVQYIQNKKRVNNDDLLVGGGT